MIYASRQQARWWLWASYAALALLFAAGILNATLVHGTTANHVMRRIEIGAVVFSGAAVFQWAVLCERKIKRATKE